MLTDDERYAAVVARAPGDFFLGVTTTGVFCRPGCPARTPKRQNVRFFGGAAEAAAAGFRPCLKCRPLGTDPRTEAAVRAARAIEAAPHERWSGPALAAATGLSARAAMRAFEGTLGLTPLAFRDAVRLRRYKSALRAGQDATHAGYEAGYGGAAARHEAQKEIGMSAAAYRAKGAGERIEVVQTETPLGTLTLAATQKGVCYCKLTDPPAEEAFEGSGSDANEGLAGLRAEFPAAQLVEAAPDTRTLRFAEAVTAFLEGHAPRPDLPVDLRGTAFQMRVWAALRAIPTGQTPTYAELAARIGSPKASRAVGSANGRNPVAVIVPCHLVVAANGLGGYAGGLERKEKLLALEAAGAARAARS